jgi:ABC-type dipeptide/oligopeptide/nickel transport system permease component
MIPTLIAVSIIAFIVIQLPPGDFLTSRINREKPLMYLPWSL